MRARKNNIFIISAPSGAGKSTLIQLLLAQMPWLFFSVSHTTRPPRQGEKDGVEYFFVSEEKFQEMVNANEFLEWAQVHGYHYGTSLSMMKKAEEEDKDLLLDVDVQGAARVRQILPSVSSIFIMPPSYDVLRDRLIRRQKDTPEQIEQRLENARREIQHYLEYDYLVVNEDLSSAFENLISIFRSERCRKEFVQTKAEAILQSFGNSKTRSD